MWCPRWPHRHTYSWGPKVKNVIFKQHLNCKTTSANVGFDKHAKLSTGICVRSSALRPSINGMKSKVNQVIWSGKKGSGKVRVIAITQLYLVLSQFSAYNFNMPESILTILGHNPLQHHYMSHDQHGVKGHVGVKGVKKVIFTKNASTNFELRSCDLYIWSIYSPCILVVLF